MLARLLGFYVACDDDDMMIIMYEIRCEERTASTEASEDIHLMHAPDAVDCAERALR